MSAADTGRFQAIGSSGAPSARARQSREMIRRLRREALQETHELMEKVLTSPDDESVDGDRS